MHASMLGLLLCGCVEISSVQFNLFFKWVSMFETDLLWVVLAMFTDIKAMCQRWNLTTQKHMVTTQLNIFKTTDREFLSHQTQTTVEVATFRHTTITMATWLWKHAQGSGTTGYSRHTIACWTLIMTGRKSWVTSPRYYQHAVGWVHAIYILHKFCSN